MLVFNPPRLPPFSNKGVRPQSTKIEGAVGVRSRGVNHLGFGEPGDHTAAVFSSSPPAGSKTIPLDTINPLPNNKKSSIIYNAITNPDNVTSSIEELAHIVSNTRIDNQAVREGARTTIDLLRISEKNSGAIIQEFNRYNYLGFENRAIDGRNYYEHVVDCGEKFSHLDRFKAQRSSRFGCELTEYDKHVMGVVNRRTKKAEFYANALQSMGTEDRNLVETAGILVKES